MSDLGERIVVVMHASDMSRRTGLIARKLGVPTAKVRRELLKLEKAGTVIRNRRYTFCNSTAWEFPSSTPD